MANTFLAGDLTADPEQRTTGDGRGYCTFTVAVNHRRQVNGKWEDGQASFHRCIIWQDQAMRLHKGDRVVLIGELSTHTYKDKQGGPHTATTVRVEEIGPSLRFEDSEAHDGEAL